MMYSALLGLDDALRFVTWRPPANRIGMISNVLQTPAHTEVIPRSFCFLNFNGSMLMETSFY